MVARDNLVATGDPRHGNKPTARSSSLMAAWLVLIALVVAVLAWLFVNADETTQRWALMQPRAVVPLPTDVPSQWTKSEPPAAPAAAAPAPTQAAPPAAEPAPAPVAAAPPQPAPKPSVALAAAPDAALIEAAPVGLLPKVGADGRQPWQAYARPFAADDAKPRVAILITGLGLSSAPTEAAINRLPPDVTLAFSPYADGLGAWLQKARDAGHEVLIDLPLEPTNYPQHDPGPYTLLTSLSPLENVARLDWVLSRGVGYIGVVGVYGSRFATSSKYLLPMFEELKKRGLMYVEAKASDDSVAARVSRDMGVPRALEDRVLDADGGRANIDAKLGEVERLARGSGQALAFASAYPATIDRLLAWLPIAQQKGLAIAPVSAIANLQKSQ